MSNIATDYQLLKDHISNLKETSKDTSDATNIQYMTTSTLPAIDFDAVKTAYLNFLGLSEEHAKSIDALALCDSPLVFIEFKNGNMQHEKGAVKNKIRDSLLILCDIICKSIGFTRENMEFILVYNEAKNSRVGIGKYLTNLEGKSSILFGLEKYEKIYFKHVYTYTEDEFNTNFLQNYKPVTVSNPV